MARQIANHVGGDQAGRDIVKNYLPTLTGMSRLIKEYGDEQGQAPQIDAFIQQLQHYYGAVTEGDVRGLDDKLLAADYLLGIDDNELYDLQLRASALEKEDTALNSALRAVYTTLGRAGTNLSMDFIEPRIQKIGSEIAGLQVRLAEQKIATNLRQGKATIEDEKIRKELEGITPLDNGILAFDQQMYEAFVATEPLAKPWFRPWLTGNDFINNEKNYCLWLSKATPSELRSMPRVMELIAKVKTFRENSKSSQKFAATPWLFRETTIPDKFLLIPKTSSERRRFFPMGFVESCVPTNSALYMANATVFDLAPEKRTP